jgi:thioredoxin 1
MSSKSHFFVLLFPFLCLFGSCTSGQKQAESSLSPVAFSEKLKASPQAVVLDVRTPGEFQKGHLAGAINYDWNGKDFGRQIAGLDKEKPVFVYCLGGGRSESAAQKMRAEGFREVYELEGGMLKWRGAGLPETTGEPLAAGGMSYARFEELTGSGKLVLVDFYADWCGPCKKLKPILEEIEKEMSGNLVVVRIDVDAHSELSGRLGIDAIPELRLYKNKKQIWTQKGLMSKEELRTRIQAGLL